jgi:hypothetical protein
MVVTHELLLLSHPTWNIRGDESSRLILAPVKEPELTDIRIL